MASKQDPPKINSETIRYIDSSFDQADSLKNRNQNPDATLNLTPIPYSDGKMVGPGQGGFRLADTPQAWVFIQKKEWLDDTWTYVVNDPIPTKLTEDLEIAQSELEQLQTQWVNVPVSQKQVLEDLTRQIHSKRDIIKKLNDELSKIKQQMAKDGVTPQIDGKLTQIDIRSALSNIITRKIDWIADHEKFTKATTSYDQSVEAQQFARQKNYIQDNFQSIQNTQRSLEESLALYDGSIRHLQEENVRLKKEQALLISKMGLTNNGAVELDKLKAQRQDLVDQVTILNAVPKPLTDAEIAAKQNTIKALNLKLKPLQTELASGQQNLQAAFAGFTDNPLTKNDRDRLETEIDSLQKIISILDSQISANANQALAYNQAQQKITEELNPAIAQLDSQIASLNADIAKQSTTKQEQDKEDKKRLDEITNSLQTNQEQINTQLTQRDVISSQIRSAKNDPTFNFDTAKLYAPVTFSGNAYTRYYKSSQFRTKPNPEARAAEEALKARVQKLEQDIINQTRTASTNSDALLQKQLEYIDTKQQLDRLSTRISAQQLDAPIVVEVGQETFNGVVELANVTQISTSVSLEGGEGSASFTIENPQNIFFIGIEDIDLALTQDPFLQSSRTLEGMVYYRGRFYPAPIVDMLVNRKGYTAGTFNTQEALSLSLSNRIDSLNKQINVINAQIAVASGLTTSTDIARLKSKQAALRADLIELQRQQQTINTSLASRIQWQVSAGISAPDLGQRMDLIRQTLMKYYAGKAIFQVMDRVYIWMTSPTRTLYQLSRKGGQFAIEDQSAMLMARQVPAMQEKLDLLQTQKKDLEEYFKRVDASPAPNGIIPSNILDVPATKIFELNQNPSTTNQKPSTTKGADKKISLTPIQARDYYYKVCDEIPQVKATIEVLKKQAKSTDYLTGAMTFNKIPSGEAMGRNLKEQQDIISSYDSRYLGIEEERLQVFQGVISSVKQTFSGGKYQISFTCRDNLIFLSMSRIMIKPALRADQGPQGILQDPIWRGNNLSGNWKNGIVVLDYAFINDEVRTRIDKKFGTKIDVNTNIQSTLRNRRVLSEEESKIYGVSPYVTSLPFARIDAANLISFIITGYPYNFETFIKNAAFGGRISFKRGAADQRSESTSYFAYLKRQIGELNDRLGDFEPYIDLQGDQFDDKIIGRQIGDFTKQQQTASQTLTYSFDRHILNRMQAFFTRLLSITKIPSLAQTVINQDPLSKTLSLKSDVVNKQLDLIKKYQEDKTFSDVNGKSTSIMVKLNEIIQAAAQREKEIVMGDGISKTYGTPVATDSEIKSVVDIILGGKAIPSDLGPFQVVKEITLQQAVSIISSTSQGGVETPPRSDISNLLTDAQLQKIKAQEAKQAAQVQAQAQASVNKVASDKLKEFVGSLLTIQAEFAVEYFSVAQISATLSNLQDILVDVKVYLSDIKSQSISIQMDVKNGPQATLEKIVRAEKKNFLIISDQYELDLDLQAYQSEMTKDFALFQSEWETPMSICKRAADQVDFEFYADENGNLQFKPPSYNRILKEHFGLVSETDGQVRNAILIRYGSDSGQILKSYLRAMSVLRKLLVEYSIKYQSAKNNLATAKQSLKSSNIPSQSDVSQNQSLSAQSQNQAAIQPQPSANQPGQSTLSQILTWLPIGAVSDAEQQAELFAQQTHLAEGQEIGKVDAGLVEKESNTTTSRSLVADYTARLQKQQQELKAAQDAGQDAKVEELKASIGLTQRQISKNQQIANQEAANTEIIRAQAKFGLYDQLYKNTEAMLKVSTKTLEKIRQKAESFVNAMPHFMDEHRIHRVADYDLISYDFSEESPKFTSLEVTGSPELVQITPAEYYWAGGVDYDNWRQYGFISENLNKAYFHSGNQARTYLRAMLGRERGRIFKASLNVRGDSKYRVGDNVFIECLGMYFYISSVSQSFSYGGDYTTSLSLTYGRRMGEIIPHPFDALGKIMIDVYQSDLEELLAQQKFMDTTTEKNADNT